LCRASRVSSAVLLGKAASKFATARERKRDSAREEWSESLNQLFARMAFDGHRPASAPRVVLHDDWQPADCLTPRLRVK
jgi:hypothetical protein